jgi:hypothetical protein
MMRNLGSFGSSLFMMTPTAARTGLSAASGRRYRCSHGESIDTISPLRRLYCWARRSDLSLPVSRGAGGPDGTVGTGVAMGIVEVNNCC